MAARGGVKPAIAAHRGGALLWPENSLIAVRGALALGVEQVEVDAHLSADNVPVVLHDATLDRTTDVQGPVRAHHLAALRGARLRGAADVGVPTLAEVAALLSDTERVLRLEVKPDQDGRPYPDVVARCLAVLDAAGRRDRTVLIAFQPRTLLDAADAGLAGTALLLEARAWRSMGPAGAIALARSCCAGEIGLPIAEWTGADVAAVRAAGLGAGAWGADRADTIAAGLALGLDVLTTDDPALALRSRALTLPPPVRA